jgi:hypothetical protein
MHKHKNVACYKCGKKGHYANKCPHGDNDDEASIRSTASDGVASSMMVSHYSKREA